LPCRYGPSGFADKFDIEPTRYAVVKAETDGAAWVLVKDNMGDTQRADLAPTVVRDESVFQDGYRDLPLKH
jgi:hypothetical protein